jgi:hypothetical protein
MTSVDWVVAGACALAAGAALAAGRRSFVASLFALFGASWIGAVAARRHPPIARAIARCLLFRRPDAAVRRDRFAAAQWIGLIALLATLAAPRWLEPPPFGPVYDDHEWTSLNIAVTRAACGEVSSVPDTDDVATYLSAHPADVHTPLKGLVRYSCSAVHPLVITQNSLMLLESATLRVDPDASLATIGRVLMALQFIGLAVFVTALTTTGVPVLFSALLVLGTATFIDALMVQFAYSIYPLTLPAALGIIGLLTVAPARGTWRLHAALAVAFGIVLGAVGNLRTDLLIIGAGPAAVALLARGRSRSILATQLTGIVAGIFVFTLLCIRPIERTQPQRLTIHPILHPVVLSLAVPDNPLARELGLQWNDAVGFDLAHRIQPGVNVLTPEYEAVLRRFYLGLWRTHPREMLTVYRLKLRYAAHSFVADSVDIGFEGQLWRSVLRPLGTRTSSGWAVPVLLALGAVGGFAALWRQPDSWVLPLTLVVIAGGLNWLEAAIVFSRFTPQYHAVAFVALVLVCLGIYQIAWQAAWWPMNRSLWPSPRDGPQRGRERRGMHAE